MPKQSEQAEEDMEIELPPLLEKFSGKLKDDRRTLLKDKAYEKPEQLRQFIGQYLYPRLEEMFRMLGGATVDTYGVAVSNSTQLQRMHAFFVDELQRLGSDIGHNDPLPGVGADVLDDFQQAFYALGALLNEKLPEDKQVEGAFNKCAGLIGEMVGQLMGEGGRDDGYDDRDDDPRDDESEGDRSTVETPAGEEDPSEGTPAETASSDDAPAKDGAEEEPPSSPEAPAPAEG